MIRHILVDGDRWCGIDATHDTLVYCGERDSVWMHKDDDDGRVAVLFYMTVTCDAKNGIEIYRASQREMCYEIEPA